jgi:hypothetical protein
MLHRVSSLQPVKGASTLFCGASVRTTLRFNLDGSDASISLHLVRLLTSSKVRAYYDSIVSIVQLELLVVHCCSTTVTATARSCFVLVLLLLLSLLLAVQAL